MNDHLKKLSIGGIEIESPVVLAPMAGYTDKTFRALCRGFGCGMTYSEMVSVSSVIHNNYHVKHLIENDESDRPFAIQLFGRDPALFFEAIRRLDGAPFDVVDINMGCPVKKITGNGEGCALMNDPPLVGRIVEATVRASARPVTVKIRKGFSPVSANAVEIARVAQESGACAVTVHGRTRDQFYSGAADLECIAAVKDSIRIPVIGNGDITDADSAMRMFEITNCDGIMPARGALGNPWLFAQIDHYLLTRERLPKPDWLERVRVAVLHLQKTVAHKGSRVGLAEMRKHLSFYIKGHPSAANLRREINNSTDESELIFILEKCVPK